MLPRVREAKQKKYGVPWEAPKLCGGNCSKCGARFGVLEVRRHCRRCGRISCKACLAPELTDVAGSFHKKPVCNMCLGSNSASFIYLAPPSSDFDLSSNERVLDKSPSDMICEGCHNYLVGDFVLLDDGQTGYCQSCFVCFADGKVLDGSFLEHEGKIYCEEHYAELFCDTCGGCSQKIVDDCVVKALGSSWHQDCFVCGMCTVPLAGMPGEQPFSFHQHCGSVYCERDYLNHFCSKCAGCGFPVNGGMNALGATWHHECFVCCECRRPFSYMEDRRFCVLDGSPYCEEDAHKVADLSPEDREVLRKMEPIPAAAARQSPEPTPEERGRAISLGIDVALKTEKATQTHGRRSQVFKHRPQWQLTLEGETPISFDFEAYGPLAFKALRQKAFQVSEEDYHRTITLRPLSGGKKGEGKSGQFFFFSWDKRYIVKTVEFNEMDFFHKCLQDYCTHLTDPKMPRDAAGCSGSLLPKFLGLYTLKFEDEPATHIVVMVNVFPVHVELREKYDLKGVIGKTRFVSDEQRENGVQVLKDRNFVNRGKWQVGEHQKQALDEMMRIDIKFLQQRDRMDYSLLLGIASISSVKELPVENLQQQWPTVECRGMQSILPSGSPGDEVYYCGIIDILQPYTVRKALESNIKKGLHMAMTTFKSDEYGATTDNSVSAMPASQYGQRFIEFLVGQME